MIVSGGVAAGPLRRRQILFCSGKLARFCQHWGSTAEQISRTKASHGFKKLLNVQDIRAAFGGFISFLLAQGPAEMHA